MIGSSSSQRTIAGPGIGQARPTIRSAPALDAAEVETLLLTCLNIARVRVLQARILGLDTLNSQTNIEALGELNHSAAEVLDALWQFTVLRGTGQGDRSRALKKNCHSTEGAHCPGGMVVMKFAELTYKNNFVFYCGSARFPGAKCASKSEKYCNQILAADSFIKLAAKEINGNADIIQATFLESCMRWRLKDIVDTVDRLDARPGAFTRAEKQRDLIQARARLREIKDQVSQNLEDAITMESSAERKKRSEWPGIAGWLVTANPSASLLDFLRDHKKQALALRNYVDQRLGERIE